MLYHLPIRSSASNRLCAKRIKQIGKLCKETIDPCSWARQQAFTRKTASSAFSSPNLRSSVVFGPMGVAFARHCSIEPA